MVLTRGQALAYRVHAQQLDRHAGHLATDTSILNLGVQDTGTDGAAWALAIRGGESTSEDDLVLVWSLRGAPHLYRRTDLPGVAAATAPFSDADAGKRIFDAAKRLRDAGIAPEVALDVIAAEMRDIVDRPTVKGQLSAALSDRLPAPYLRECRPCQAVHAYEQPFRLASLRAGLELRRGTSPPVLERIPGWTGAATYVPPHLDVVRAYLHLLGPATPRLVAAFLDSPVNDVKRRWPADAVEIALDGERRWMLAADVEAVHDVRVDPDLVRLLAPYDLFLQARDRDLLVPEEQRRKQLWVVLGRPGAVLRGHEIVGTWRGRSTGGRHTVTTDLWQPVPQGALEAECDRLASHRARVRGTTARAGAP